MKAKEREEEIKEYCNMSISIWASITQSMLYFSIKAQKTCVTRTSNCKFFYNLAIVPSYFYDAIVAYCII